MKIDMLKKNQPGRITFYLWKKSLLDTCSYLDAFPIHHFSKILGFHPSPAFPVLIGLGISENFFLLPVTKELWTFLPSAPGGRQHDCCKRNVIECM